MELRVCGNFPLVVVDVGVNGFATLASCFKSRWRRRTRLHIFTRLGLSRPASAPNSRPSLCLARPGLKEVVLALSGPTYPSWLRSGKVDAREHHKQTGKCRDRRRDAPWRLLAQFASRMEPSILRRRISRSVICDQAVCRSQMTSAAVDAEQKTLFDSAPNVGLR